MTWTPSDEQVDAARAAYHKSLVHEDGGLYREQIAFKRAITAAHAAIPSPPAGDSAGMREALEPFANFDWDEHPECADDARLLSWGELTVGDLRRAREALHSTPAPKVSEGELRTKFVQAIVAEWDKNHSTQNSSMAIQAANACVAVLALTHFAPTLEPCRHPEGN